MTAELQNKAIAGNANDINGETKAMAARANLAERQKAKLQNKANWDNRSNFNRFRGDGGSG